MDVCMIYYLKVVKEEKNIKKLMDEVGNSGTWRVFEPKFGGAIMEGYLGPVVAAALGGVARYQIHTWYALWVTG